jgi:hypothetical protein
MFCCRNEAERSPPARTTQGVSFWLFNEEHEIQLSRSALSREVLLHRKQRRAEQIEGPIACSPEPKVLV